MRVHGTAAQCASGILRGFTLLLLLCADLAQAVPRAEIPYRYRMLVSGQQVGPIDPLGNVLVMQDLAAVHLVDVTTNGIVRSLDLIPTVEDDRILGYHCDLAARRIYIFQVAAVTVWSMDTGLVTETFSLPDGISGPPTKVRADGTWLFNDFEAGTLYRYDLASRSGGYLLADRFIVEVSHDGTFALQQEVIETEATFSVIRIDNGQELGTMTLSSIGIPQRLLNTSIVQRGAVLSHDGMHLGTWNQESGALAIYRVDTGALVDEVDTSASGADHLLAWGPSGLLLQNLVFNRGVYTSSLFRYTPDSPGVLQSYDLPGYQYMVSSTSEDGGTVYGAGAELTLAGVFPATGQSWVNAIDLETGDIVTNVAVIAQYLGDIIPASQAEVIGVVGELGLSTWSATGVMTSFRWNSGNSLARRPSISPLGDWLSSCFEFQCQAVGLVDVAGNTNLWVSSMDDPSELIGNLYVSSSFSPDGKLLLVRGSLEHLLMRVPEGEVVERFSSPEPLGFTGFDERDVLFRLGEKGEQSLLAAAPIDDRTAVRFSIPEPDFVDEPIVSSDGLRLYGVDVGTGIITEVSVTDGTTRSIPLNGDEVAGHIALSPDNTLLAASTPTQVQVIRLDNLAVQQRIGAIIHTATAFTHDSRWLLVEEESVTQWPVSTDTCLEVCPGEDLDTDGDGLSDCYERCANTRPWNSDTDGDGKSDGDEVADGSDPTVSDQVIEGAEEGEGMAEGGAEGTPEGAEEGSSEGSVEGISEGLPEGFPDGALEGDSEGVNDGEGSHEGLREGTHDGEGSIEGGGEGVLEGALE
ncbi:MAG: hypothetical protein RLZZ303_3728, partial [Candidatus Hydrogenedentota bacterium]